MQTPEQIRAEARRKIDAADKKLYGILAEFNLTSKASKNTVPSQEKKDFRYIGDLTMFRHNGPRYLFNRIAQMIELPSDDIKEHRRMALKLAEALSERFHAIDKITLSKQAEGKDAYDKTRHQSVIDRGAAGVKAAGGSYKLGYFVFKTIADEFAKMQKDFLDQDVELEKKTGPIADYIRSQSISAASVGWTFSHNAKRVQGSTSLSPKCT